jgi:hypothetical protein
VKVVNKVIGIALIVLALAIIIVPMFTDCESQGKYLTTSTGKEISMKCHWAGLAEIATGVPLLAVGIIMLLTRRKSNLYILGIIGVVMGVLTIMFPSNIIGVCQTPTMLCNTAMRPALIILGVLAIVGSAGIMLWARKSGE